MFEAETLPTLTTSRLSLRALRVTDAGVVFDIFRDPEVMRYWSCLPFASPSQAEQLIAKTHLGFEQRTFFQWGIAHAEDDRIIGTCTLFALDLQNLRTEVGFILARSCWGQGYMQEVLQALFTYAFGPLGLHRIEADVDPRNERSLATLKAQGFQREGLLRERWLVAGERQDSVFLGLLHADWLAAASQMPAATEV
jgi:[ribosomal protein S5]-alanine N-acetyltransferase